MVEYMGGRLFDRIFHRDAPKVNLARVIATTQSKAAGETRIRTIEETLGLRAPAPPAGPGDPQKSNIGTVALIGIPAAIAAFYFLG